MEIRYVSVHSLNQYIKARFLQDTQLQNIYIKGEVSNYRPHPSGHLYFTLKDDTSRISAVMFASAAKKNEFSTRKWNASFNSWESCSI
jgi:exodeoxyribonuclease VII large subunit